MHRNWEWEAIECLAQSYTGSELSMFQVRKCAIAAGQGKKAQPENNGGTGYLLVCLFSLKAYIFTGSHGKAGAFFCDRLQEDLANMTEENHEQTFLRRSCYVRELWDCREKPEN